MLGLSYSELLSRYMEIQQTNQEWIKERFAQAFPLCRQAEDYVECAAKETALNILPVLIAQLMDLNNEALTRQIMQLLYNRQNDPLSACAEKGQSSPSSEA